MALTFASRPIVRALCCYARERDLDAEIENLKLTIAKLQHERFGPSSERVRLLDQLELQLNELVEHVAQAATEDELAAAQSSEPTREPARPRRKPARCPLPQHLARERRVEPSPVMCPCCGGKLRKLGEDITETLERVPAQWKVIRHVREKWTCRDCETVTQPPAPSHPIARGRAGPQLLGEVLLANTAHTFRSTGRAISTRARASISMYRRWPIG